MPSDYPTNVLHASNHTINSMPISNPFTHSMSLCVAALLPSITAAAEIPTGGGSYLDRRPTSCKPLPETVHRVASLTGATPTNQWWSSLVWKPFSQNLFAHPLGMVCHKDGLGVTYPGAAIVGAETAIMGGGVNATGDFIIGHSSGEEFTETRLADSSDWFVTARFEKGDVSLNTTFGHGSPFIYGQAQGGSPTLKFAEKPQIWSGKPGEATLGITVRGNHYGLFGPSKSQWKLGDSDSTYTNQSEASYFSVALLPDNKPATLSSFRQVAHQHVVDTQVDYRIDNGHVISRFRFTTRAMEGKGKETIFALYPHQWKYTSSQLGELEYASVRGRMKLGRGSEFTTRVPIQGLLPRFPVEGIPDTKRMLAYLEKNKPAGDQLVFKDTYWEGKHLGKLATLSGIAEALGEIKLQKGYIDEIKARLENWFTSTPGEDSPLFYYNKTWGTLIGSKPSYGSDEQINDHHFHYGYFIRAAAEVVRFDPKWEEKWGPMVELLIRDIASLDRNDPLFPHLRCFDQYAGHSWASGHADFADGNNQESSSESMNAWYGLILWGEVTGNQSIRDTGLALYNVERTAVEEYWFDVSETNFPKSFPQVALGMVWGGKGAFATWFSGDIDCIHGINWLPFTPASIYMGRFPDYVKKNHDRIVEKREGGDDYNTGWGDLVVMFNALSDPSMAASYIDSNPNCKLEGGNTHAFMYHWVHTLDRLGRNDASVTSNHPYVNVFNKDGQRTYAAYNFEDTPLEVSFSDGKKLTAAPKQLTIDK